MTYTVSTWDRKEDNAVKLLHEGSWEDVVEILLDYKETPNKTSVPLFNLNKFDALANKTGDFVECKRTREFCDRRTKNNIRLITGLVVDYDNDSVLQHLWTMEEVAEKFKQYEHLIYTSYSHWKNENIDKFRLILPLEEPIEVTSGDDYDCWVLSLREFFGYEEPQDLPKEMYYRSKSGTEIKRDKSAIDPVSFVPSQGFFIPSCPVGNKVEYHYNQGEFVSSSNFTKGERLQVEEINFEIPADATIGGEGVILKTTFNALEFFKTAGMYKRNLNNQKHQVICPWVHEHGNEDQTGTIMIERPGKLDVLYCHHNHDVTMWRLVEELGEDARQFCLTREIDPVGDFLKSRLTESVKKQEVEQQFQPDNLELHEPYNMEKRFEMVKKTITKIIKNKPIVTVLYAFEGFGKSYSATEFLQQTQAPVVIASFSNAQARKVQEDFTNYGFNVQLISGRADRLWELYQVVAETNELRHPWDSDNVDKPKTVAKIMSALKCSEEKAIEAWDITKPDTPDFENHRIISTTIARTQVWGRVQGSRMEMSFKSNQPYLKDDRRIIPNGTLVFFDDPDKQFFREYADYNEDYKDVSIDGRPIEVIQRLDKEWFVRPAAYKLGYGLVDTRLIFTTTESMIVELIKKSYPEPYVPKLMPERMSAGNITIIKTKMTSAKQDGILPPVAVRVDKLMSKHQRHDVVYLANGQGTQHNLKSSRGKNEFKESDTVIEISSPHYWEVLQYIVEFDWDTESVGFMRAWISLDDLQQAIGRNSGYRWVDQIEADRRQCIVLCEPRLLSALLGMMRYAVETVVLNPEDQCSRHEEFDTLLKTVCWLLVYTSQYIQSGVGNERLAFKHDVNDVIKHLEPAKRFIFKKRLGAALNTRIVGAGKGLKTAIETVQNTIN